MKLKLGYRLVTVLAVWCSGCVSIPKEAPDLSIELGKQITALQSSHEKLVRVFFQDKRDEVNKFLRDTWIPAFAVNFFSDPEIKQDWELKSTKESTRLDFILETAPVLQTVIDEKRQELLKPLNDLEVAALASIRREYDLAHAANGSITSFLISASKVKENQQRYLQMLKIPDERIASVIDQTDAAIDVLLGHTETVSSGIDKLKAFEDQAASFKENLSKIKETLKQ